MSQGLREEEEAEAGEAIVDTTMVNTEEIIAVASVEEAVTDMITKEATAVLSVEGTEGIIEVEEGATDRMVARTKMENFGIRPRVVREAAIVAVDEEDPETTMGTEPTGLEAGTEEQEVASRSAQAENMPALRYRTSSETPTIQITTRRTSPRRRIHSSIISSLRSSGMGQLVVAEEMEDTEVAAIEAQEEDVEANHLRTTVMPKPLEHSPRRTSNSVMKSLVPTVVPNHPGEVATAAVSRKKNAHKPTISKMMLRVRSSSTIRIEKRRRRTS